MEAHPDSGPQCDADMREAGTELCGGLKKHDHEQKRL